MKNRIGWGVLLLCFFGVMLVIAVDSWAAQESTRAYVKRYVDGDTLVIQSGEHVRILGIDTPERGECGYKLATVKLSSLAVGRVYLYRDAAEPNRDRYGRLLRYVTDNYKDVGYMMVRTGYAEAYLKYPTSRTPKYARAETAARAEKAGLWGLCGHP